MIFLSSKSRLYTFAKIQLMEEILHQYVVYPIIYKVLYNYIPSGYIARFNPATYLFPSSFPTSSGTFPTKNPKVSSGRALPRQLSSCSMSISLNPQRKAWATDGDQSCQKPGEMPQENRMRGVPCTTCFTKHSCYEHSWLEKNHHLQ